MNFSFKKLITSLVDIIIESPSSILFIILGIIFSVAMIVNMKKNKTIGKTLYITGWIFIIAFIIIKYNNFISKIFDNLINTIFMQIFFPNLAAYTAIIIITNIIFLHTIFNKKNNMTNKLINSPFFIAIMVLMVHTIDQISKNNINIYQRKEVYSNDKIVTIIESTTLIFTLWIIILISKIIIKKLIKKSDEKIIQEYNENKTNEETIGEESEPPTAIPSVEINKSINNEPILNPTIEVVNTPNVNPTTKPVINNTPILNPTIEIPNNVVNTPNVNPTTKPAINNTPILNPTIEVPNNVVNTPNINSTTKPVINNTPATVVPNNVINTSNINPTTKPAINNTPILNPTIEVPNNVVNTPNVNPTTKSEVNNTPVTIVPNNPVVEKKEIASTPKIFNSLPANNSIQKEKIKPIIVFPKTEEKKEEIEVLKI